jgi:hypothetical protein
MIQGRSGKLTDVLSDFFSDAWKLLSETTIFLSRTKEFHLYENQLRLWRSELQSSYKNSELVQRIRSEVTGLRKHLRLQGYDLSLGRQNLIFDGFRNDASLAEGFRRVVLFITGTDIFWLTGDGNHIALASLLERQIETGTMAQKQIRILSKHYLWFCRMGTDLILAGSDTEMKEDFEHLKAMGEANSLLFLSRLKKLK